jgi:hypothetical protein
MHSKLTGRKEQGGLESSLFWLGAWEAALSSGFPGMSWWLVGMPSEGMKGPSVSLFPKH